MKFDTKYRIDEACSKDMSRQNICHVELDVERKRMLATNGHCAVIVPCGVDPGDRSGPIQSEAIREARKSAPRKKSFITGHTVIGDGAIRARSKVLDVNGKVMYRRPERRPAVPIDDTMKTAPRYGDARALSVTLDPELLLTAARAMGRVGNRIMVTLTFNAEAMRGDYRDPIMLSADGENAYAVVMPGRR